MRVSNRIIPPSESQKCVQLVLGKGVEECTCAQAARAPRQRRAASGGNANETQLMSIEANCKHDEHTKQIM